MKIAVLGTRGFPGVQGGVEAHCENLYPRLATQGHNVTVFTRLRYVDPLIKEFRDVKLVPLACPRRWKLAIAGRADHEDRYSKELKAKVEAKVKSGVPVVLTGFITGGPLAELYSNAGIFALPSYYEGLPIALLEAMSYGLSCPETPKPRRKNLSNQVNSRKIRLG